MLNLPGVKFCTWYINVSDVFSPSTGDTFSGLQTRDPKRAGAEFGPVRVRAVVPPVLVL